LISVRNPRTGLDDYTIHPLTHNELIEIAADMRHHQALWYSKGIDHRISILNQWTEVVFNHKDEIIQALVVDSGRYGESVLEFNLLPTTIDRWIKWAPEFFNQPRDKKSQVPNIGIKQDFVPYELVSVISPWNFPLLLSIIDTIPALLAGCAVLVKPSEITPRFIEVIQSTIDQVPNLKLIFKYVSGDGVTGSSLVQLSDITCFTGSVATGLKVYQQAANLFKPCFLELGGKDAAVVVEGANIQNAARSILWGSTVNCGHSCLSIERVYVQAGVYDAFVSVIIEEASKVSLASETPNKGQIGPVISSRQVAIINDHLSDAIKKGATIINGNSECETINGGIYCKPTILINVTHDMKVMTEETFGPIIPIMKFDKVEDGIALANDSIFGLSGAVFAATNEEAIDIASKMTAGAISINECALTAIVHDGEKNSFKYSGIGGTRMGPASMQRFLRKKAYLINELTSPSPWWF
jgi:succinate-semialdehyde dehydrogenase / glutarate-semialdehyde dehydrogenase